MICFTFKRIDYSSTTQGLPYDFGSIMNFVHYACSKNELSSTIIPVNDSIPKEAIGVASRPSEQDYLDINLTYCGMIKCMHTCTHTNTHKHPLCFILIFLCPTVGTETAMGTIIVNNKGTEFIRLKWNQLKHFPISFTWKCLCFLPCKVTPYLTLLGDIPPGKNVLSLTELNPSSVCKIHFLALYNPSGHDRGVNYAFETLSSSKSKLIHTCTKIHTCHVNV